MNKGRFITVLMVSLFLAFGVFNAYAAEETIDTPLVITPQAWDSGTIDLGTQKAVVFTLRNEGLNALVVRSIGLKGNSISAFSINAPTLPMTIAPSEEIAVEITFSPTTLGLHSVALDVQYEEGGI